MVRRNFLIKVFLSINNINITFFSAGLLTVPLKEVDTDDGRVMAVSKTFGMVLAVSRIPYDQYHIKSFGIYL